MGFFLTETITNPTAEPPARRPGSVAKTSIGAPFSIPILSSKYWDSDTKTLAFQLRDYGPSIARWLSRDPIGDESFFRVLIKGKTWRIQKYWRDKTTDPGYLYVRNSPAVHVDYLGLKPWGFKYHGNWCGPGWTGGEEKDSGKYDWPNASTNVVGRKGTSPDKRQNALRAAIGARF